MVWVGEGGDGVAGAVSLHAAGRMARDSSLRITQDWRLGAEAKPARVSVSEAVFFDQERIKRASWLRKRRRAVGTSSQLVLLPSVRREYADAVTNPVSKAIFISYASQDAEAARRICETLRAEGVEIWFDADGGLEHGDEWDAKIRRQIKECVLFMPVISANTQARLEGYFRIEWELAAQRALGIAAGVPFILPVVIDDTREPDALVPDRFRMVQWTRLPGGVVPPEVKARYLKLWSHRTGVLKAQAADVTASPAPFSGGSPVVPVRGPGATRWLLAAGAAAALVAAVYFFPRTTQPAAGSPGKVAGSDAGAEAEQLVRRARELIYDPDAARNEFALAEGMLRRATEIAPLSGPAWGASALLNQYYNTRGYDFSRERLVRAQAEADKALRLDGSCVDALLALGLQRDSMGETDRARDFLERAAALEPSNPRVILAQSSLLKEFSARVDHLKRNLVRTPAPAELHYYVSLNRSFDRRTRDAIAELEPAITSRHFWRVWVQRAFLEMLDSGDSAKVEAWLDRVPDLKRDEPRVALIRYEAAMLRRDGAAAVRVLNSVASDYFYDNFFEGPKSFLLAQALEMAGQAGRAREQWLLTEKKVREKLGEKPGWLLGKTMLAQALQGLGREAEARALAEACGADADLPRARRYSEVIALLWVKLGEPARALQVLLAIDLTASGYGFLSEAVLVKDRQWDPIRKLPDYGALLKMLREDEHVPKRAYR